MSLEATGLAPWSVTDEQIDAVVSAIIDGKNCGKTLVHCAAGVSRSPGFTTAAICFDGGIPWDDGLAIVAAGRERTDIHPLIEERLRKWLLERR